MKYVLRYIFWLIPVFYHYPLCAQDIPENQYDNIIVIINVQGIGSFESEVIYHNTRDKVFISVSSLFDFLKIRNITDDQQLMIKGFFIDEQRKYEIDVKQKTILLDGNVNHLSDNDLLITESGIHINIDILGQIFGLYSTFSFRNMTIDIKTDLELPAIREMRLMQYRQNIQQLQGESPADTTYDQNYHIFRFGMVDWSLISTQVAGKKTDTRLSLGVGMELFAGETNIFLNHSTREGINLRNQHYLWRFVNNSNPYIKQIQVGKISPGTISTVFQPFHGITVTNASTSLRKFFGTYNYSAYTQPGWLVELYVNGVMITYLKADESGFYSFEVPIIYGSSQVMLKFYGPYGEERIKEQFINIPFLVLPKGEFEYSVSSAYLHDVTANLLVKASGTYGITNKVSLGGGYEHFMLSGKPSIPIANLTVNPIKNLIISGEYAHGVRSKGLLHYRWRNKWMIELDYSIYTKGQKAINYNYVSERRGTLHIPYRSKNLSGAVRLSYKQNAYELLNYNTGDLTVNAYRGAISASFTTYSTWINDRPPVITGNFLIGFRMPNQFVIRPQIIYNYTSRELISAKLELEKRISRSGSISIAYHENFSADYRGLEFSFRWDLSFTQIHSSLIVSNFDIITGQGANGSLTCDAKKPFISPGNKASVGRSGLLIYPFLDVNHNGIIEEDEPLVSGVNMKISGGKILDYHNDTLVRIMELEPFTTYSLRLEDANLKNIAWHLGAKKINIVTDPNQFKLVPVPVRPMGEVNGSVTISADGRQRGQGRMRINIYDGDGTQVAGVISENDGYFTYLGLAPGKYMISLDSLQLRRLGLESAPRYVPITIKPDPYGDIIYDINFTLKRVHTDTLEHIAVTTLHGQDSTSATSENARSILSPISASDAIRTQEGVIEKTIVPGYGQPDTLHQLDDSTEATAGHVQLWPSSPTKPDSLHALPVEPDITHARSDSATSNVMMNQKPVMPVEAHHTSQAKPDSNAEKTSNTKTHRLDTIADPTNIVRAADFKPDPAADGVQVFVQAGAFIRYANAMNYAKKISSAVPETLCIVYENQYFKVRVGHFSTLGEAEAYGRHLQEKNHRYFIDTANYGTYRIDCGQFPDKSSALRRLKQLEIHAPGIIVIQPDDTAYSVFCGYLNSRQEAEVLLIALKTKGVKGLKIVD